jgi:uncharacterized protein YukE
VTDQIKYNYAAMDDAYEDMLGAGKVMRGQVEDLMGDAKALLDQMGGGFADGYEMRAQEIRSLFDDLNLRMEQRAQQLNDMFADMGVFDQKLGDGI